MALSAWNTVQSIVGKYFINSLQCSLTATAVIHGRILGPVGNELSPVYLCEIYPVVEIDDIADLGITTHVCLSLDQLIYVHLYDDKEFMLLRFRELVASLSARAAAKRAKGSASATMLIVPSGETL